MVPVVRIQLCGLQLDPYSETASAERVKKQPTRPSVAADGGRADAKNNKRTARSLSVGGDRARPTGDATQADLRPPDPLGGTASRDTY